MTKQFLDDLSNVRYDEGWRSGRVGGYGDAYGQRNPIFAQVNIAPLAFVVSYLQFIVYLVIHVTR